ncbi:hypothetical protein M197_gp57 [Haloarcula hispanica tailed virus 2]|uniref:Uncharacterized protein n=1 Tax=Haloarcula hispanica tailed virus 2 TaxID=1273751 RepID=R4TKM2_9CAUD|nr:hypothetical protein M197_gp57 [Haloarcula hispanica tailed virus 2]AGM11222.1 hypothetical protein HHTV2_57 [Haloarcula hispanica tailed virus 2]
MPTDNADMNAADDQNDGWDPQPATLRDGETTDVSSHAARNIAQIRQAAREGDLGEDQAEAAVERIRRRDAEEQG